MYFSYLLFCLLMLFAYREWLTGLGTLQIAAFVVCFLAMLRGYGFLAVLCTASPGAFKRAPRCVTASVFLHDFNSVPQVNVFVNYGVHR